MRCCRLRVRPREIPWRAPPPEKHSDHSDRPSLFANPHRPCRFCPLFARLGNSQVRIVFERGSIMSIIDQSGAFALGDRIVKRIGFGAMQLAGPGVFGPPKDRDAAVAVLREAVARGVNHIDTSDFYGPYVVN